MANEAKGFSEVNKLLEEIEKLQKKLLAAEIEKEEVEENNKAIIEESKLKKYLANETAISNAKLKKELHELNANIETLTAQYNEKTAELEKVKADLEKKAVAEEYAEELTDQIIETEERLKKVGNRLEKLQDGMDEIFEKFEIAKLDDVKNVYLAFGINIGNDGADGKEAERLIQAVNKSKKLSEKQEKDGTLVGETDYKNKVYDAINRINDSRIDFYYDVFKNDKEKAKLAADAAVRSVDEKYVQEIIDQERNKVKGTVKSKKTWKIIAGVAIGAIVFASAAFGVHAVTKTGPFKDRIIKVPDPIPTPTPVEKIDLTEEAQTSFSAHKNVLKVDQDAGIVTGIKKMIYNPKNGEFSIVAEGVDGDRVGMYFYGDGFTTPGDDKMTAEKLFNDLENRDAQCEIYSALYEGEQVVNIGDNTKVLNNVVTLVNKETGSIQVKNNAIVIDGDNYYVVKEIEKVMNKADVGATKTEVISNVVNRVKADKEVANKTNTATTTQETSTSSTATNYTEYEMQ